MRLWPSTPLSRRASLRSAQNTTSPIEMRKQPPFQETSLIDLSLNWMV
jgi:hypothetical protein